MDKQVIGMKERIIQKAIELFNEQGFFNVRIRDISSALDTSSGSISYHFKNKEALMSSIYRYMVKTLKEMSIGERLFMNKEEEMKVEVAQIYLAYMQKFRFFFQDTFDIIRAYPEIGEMHQRQISEEINILKNLMYVGVGRGVFIPEPVDGIYESLMETIWQTMHFWFARRAIKGEIGDGLEKAISVINNLLYPYLTEKGQEDYQRIFSAVIFTENTSL